jgi:hypothetical protein
MGTTLTGNKIKDTYKSLIKVSDSTEASSSAKQLSDGDGNDLGLYIDTDGVFGIGAPASFTLDISSATDGVALPVGTTANRPTGSAGIIRYNSTLGKLEYYDTAFKQIASESYVSTAIDNLIDLAPGTLDTLNEIAAALNDDPDFHTTITTLINGKEDTITGAATTITDTDLTASRAVISGTGGKIEVSVVTSTELGYLSGVNSALQTQIDSKENTITGAATTITDTNLTADKAVVSNSSGKIATSSVTSTELGYLSGVTDGIQSQIDSKENTITGAATTITSTDLTASKVLISNASGKVAASSVTETELGYVSGVNSAIQTQIDSKQDVLTPGTGITISGSTIATDLSNLIDTGAIQNDAVTAIKLDQFDDNLTALTAGDILVSNGTDFDNVTVTGDVTINSSGVTSIGSDKVDEDNLKATNAPTDGYVLTYDSATSGFTWEQKFDGDITGIVAGNGLTGDSTSGDATLAVGAGNLIDVSSDAVNVDLSKLTTSTANGDGDYFVVVDTINNQKKLTKGNINISEFNNDAGYTSNIGDITGVTAGSGLSGGGSSGTVTLNLDFSELTDKTTDISGTTEFIIQDGLTESRKAASEIKLSNFNNDAGWTSNVGDITGVTAGTGLSGGGNSGTVTISHAAHTGDVTGSTSLTIAENAVNGSKIADDSIDSEHYVAGSIDEEHLNVTNAPTDNYVLSYDQTSGGFTWVESAGGGGGIDWDSTVQTGNFTATAGAGYFVNTTSAEITVTLPSSPTAGDEVSIVDYAGTADTNYITITSSNNINGVSDDFLINYERGGVSMVYVDATQGWIAYNAANETATALNVTPLTVDYLVVAGGGGGGRLGGGGGAGGLRSTVDSSGGGASAESSLTLATATDYTVSVGPGGAGGTTLNGAGANGTNSTFSTITSDGGGGGGSHATGNGVTGGSGGGAPSAGSSQSAGAGTSGQGYAGGINSISATAYGAGGGGGAAAAGANGTSTAGGNGGIGDQISITGTSTYYAGGGGGGCQSNNTPGTGGAGGGANGTGNTSTPSNATPNTGGGGGGSGYTTAFANGGNGASGVVIIRYPDTYTISETTSPTVLSFTTDSSSVSGYNITTFTAGENGTIQFTAV